MIIELIRHGETALQAEGRYQGVTDAPLSPEGKKKLKRAEKQPEKVYVTPLLRTRQTAAILFPDAGQVVVPGLAEMNFGIFEGRSAGEMENDPAYQAWVDGLCQGKCPGGESKDEFCSRASAAFTDLVRQASAEKSEVLVIVAHGGIQMAVLERFADVKKNYWEWMLSSGQGYLLETGEPDGSHLHVLGIRDHTQDRLSDGCSCIQEDPGTAALPADSCAGFTEGTR